MEELQRRRAEAERIEQHRRAELERQGELRAGFISDMKRDISTTIHSGFHPSSSRDSGEYLEIRKRLGDILEGESIIYYCKYAEWGAVDKHFIVLESGIAWAGAPPIDTLYQRAKKELKNPFNLVNPWGGVFRVASTAWSADYSLDRWYIPFEDLEEIAVDNEGKVLFLKKSGGKHSCPWKHLAGEVAHVKPLIEKIVSYSKSYRSARDIYEEACDKAVDAKALTYVEDYLKAMKPSPLYQYLSAKYYYTLASEELSERERAIKLDLAMGAISVFAKDPGKPAQYRSEEDYRKRVGHSTILRAQIMMALGRDKDEISAILNSVRGSSYPEKVNEEATRLIRLIQEKARPTDYIEKPYFERQFLMVVDDARGMKSNDIKVFSRHDLPEGVSFEGGRPDRGELYVAHPSIQGLYVPYAQHEERYFIAKIHELIELLQALGAMEVAIVSQKGQTVSEILNKALSVGGGASFKNDEIEIGAESAYSQRKELGLQGQNTSSIRLKVSNEALHKPYVPERLVWYPSEPVWQAMAKQRAGGLTQYSLQVSSKDALSISDKRRRELKASLKETHHNLDLKFSAEYEKMFEAQEETETVWEIRVQFRPLSEYY